MAEATEKANLGRVLPKPRGGWIEGMLYNYLNMVSHNGSSYIALKDNAVEPSDDGENWMFLSEGTSIATTETAGKVKPDGETILADEDGTLHSASQVPEGVTFVDLEAEDETLPAKIPVNADQLGGQNPEYYATEESVSEIIGGETAVGKAMDADTVDGYHAEDFAKRFAFVDFVDQDYTFAAMQSLVPKENKIYRLQLEANGHVQLWESLDNGATWAVKKVLSADYLPLTGGLVDYLNIKNSRLWLGDYTLVIQSDINHFSMYNTPVSNNLGTYRGLRILNPKFAPNVGNSLTFMESVDGVETGYNVLHAGNSNPIIQSTSAPTDTTALWYNTTTKTLKSYTDGAWT